MNKHRAQCLVVHDDKILVVKHRQYGYEYYCLPGGGVEEGETPKQAAKRELFEECCVRGSKLRLISKVFLDKHYNYTYCADIGNQAPVLGEDPECRDNPILVGAEWRSLGDLCERDRAWMWSAGLVYYDGFSNELGSWGDDISYPRKRSTNTKVGKLTKK